jgi:hypothetical protein
VAGLPIRWLGSVDFEAAAVWLNGTPAVRIDATGGLNAAVSVAVEDGRPQSSRSAAHSSGPMSTTAVHGRRRTSIVLPKRFWLRLTASVQEGRSSITLSGRRLRVTRT